VARHPDSASLSSVTTNHGTYFEAPLLTSVHCISLNHPLTLTSTSPSLAFGPGREKYKISDPPQPLRTLPPVPQPVPHVNDRKVWSYAACRHIAPDNRYPCERLLHPHISRHLLPPRLKLREIRGSPCKAGGVYSVYHDGSLLCIHELTHPGGGVWRQPRKLRPTRGVQIWRWATQVG